jgi:hypothetical protein
VRSRLPPRNEENRTGCRRAGARRRTQAVSALGIFNLVWFPRTDSHLTYMIDIDLTTEFTIPASGVR